jgi:hypothetical protein
VSASVIMAASFGEKRSDAVTERNVEPAAAGGLQLVVVSEAQ